MRAKGWDMVMILCLFLVGGCGAAQKSSPARELKMDIGDRPYFAYKIEQGGSSYIVLSSSVSAPTREKHPYAIVAMLPYAATDSGIPTKSDYARISKLEEQLIDAMSEKQVWFVGHVIGDQKLISIFYSARAFGPSITFKTGLLSKITIDVDCREDRGWRVYFDHIRPTSDEALAAQYGELLDVLRKEGDVPTKVRSVDFAARFQGESDRAAFIREVADDRYVPTSQGAWEDDEGGHWVELGKASTLVPGDILAKVRFLTEVAERHGGEFDGWACSVEK